MIYRLEAGEDVTVSSLLAVLTALGMGLRIERAGLPTQEEVTARFLRDEDDDAGYPVLRRLRGAARGS